jgi:type I restriction enzyme S subunit
MTNLPAGWRVVEIDQLGEVVTGNTPATKNTEFYGDKYPFITPSDLDFVSRTEQTERFLSEKGKEEVRTRLLPANAVCFTSIGATIGKMCMTSRLSVTNQQINSIIVDKTKHDPRFVYYLLRHNIESIKSLAGGAATPIVSKSKFAQAQVIVPPLPTQRKIAAILSAYDDLIENNARRIAILEEMAQLLYREWFVHFRFPGHEDVALVDSELGAIPEEWEVKKFSELAKKRHNRITPSEFETEVFSYHSFPTFDDNKLPKLELGADIGSAKYIVHKGSVLLSRLNPRISRVWLPHLNSEHRAIASTEFVVLLPKPPITRAYLYNLGRSTDFRSRFVGLTGGTSTSHQRVNHRDLLNMKVIYPSPDLIEAFSDITTPMLKLSNTLRLRNITIRHTRDLLLPRLVSGELDVSNLDISIGGS